MPATISGPLPPDTGTGEHTHNPDPVTVEADDVDNKATSEADQADNITYTADDVDNATTGEVAESGPVTVEVAELLPAKAENKQVKKPTPKASKATTRAKD